MIVHNWMSLAVATLQFGAAIEGFVRHNHAAGFLYLTFSVGSVVLALTKTN